MKFHFINVQDMLHWLFNWLFNWLFSSNCESRWSYGSTIIGYKSAIQVYNKLRINSTCPLNILPNLVRVLSESLVLLSAGLDNSVTI